jgi:predicted MFS family arabinose efflux permease
LLKPDRPLRLQIPILVAVRLVFNTMIRMIYPFLSYFSAGLGVGLPEMAAALTLRSVAGMFSPFLASVADSRGRKTGMLLGILLFSFGVSLVVFWPVFPAFVLALVFSTVGTLVFIPSLQAYLGDRIPYERRGLVIALTELSWSLGFIVGVPTVGFMIAKKGWLTPFPLLALLGVISLALLAWMLPRDPARSASPPSFLRNISLVFSYPPARAGLLMVACYSAANEVINFVFGVWMGNVFGLVLAGLSALTVGIGLAEMCGESLVGALTDRLGKQRALSIGLALNCLTVLILPFTRGWLPGAIASLMLFFLSFEFTIVSGIPLMTEVLPPARATLMAAHMAFISLGRALGDVLAPFLYSQQWLPSIAANALAAFLFNVLAIIALNRVRLPDHEALADQP